MVEKKLITLFTGFAERLYQHGEDDIPDILIRDGQLSGKELGQPPESFLKENLIWDTLEALGLEFRKEPYSSTGRERPDFEVLNTSTAIFGECKRFNDIGVGIDQMDAYLKNTDLPTRYGMVVDGLDWVLMGRRSYRNSHTFVNLSLRDWLLRYYIHNYPQFEWMADEIDTSPSTGGLRSSVRGFTAIFSKEDLEETISQHQRLDPTWPDYYLKNNQSIGGGSYYKDTTLDEF